MQTFNALLAVLLAALQVSAGPITVAKRDGVTSTTSLNPWSEPSGAHIITPSGLPNAWPTGVSSTSFIPSSSVTSLNPWSEPSGAHISTSSGLPNAWPTGPDSSASSSSATASPTPFCWPFPPFSILPFPSTAFPSGVSIHWPPYTVEWSSGAWSWPTSLPSGVASSAGSAPSLSFQPGGPIIPACPVVICYASGSEVFEPTSTWGTASSAPTTSSWVSATAAPASETSS
ncbi:hypothetical protein DICSQDRAFT_175256 [Dichomitus squalens LYAD-421 SS1]|uniref:Ig-like domain-containing protein n=1 Tax=Dichomitus squalens (strain LYAD-421) TaxID=732165 RepID=R7SIT7_DICSQ|nr:uncharacterized protein DICSQDRAFT_175256 [Dichomitus squalens LYAD-421 SS1]EJF56059.1 hypothetical protein DICSQDRAFT_175256 [Dichomitus squalens LYAD-421 SS1]